MPYTKVQQTAHIRELQELLYGISFFNPAVPRIIPDGIYGTETAGAVKDFQQYYGLRTTGETNQATWEKIAEVYRELTGSAPAPLEVFPEQRGMVYTPGARAFPIMVVQTILTALSERFANIPPCHITGELDTETVQTLQLFQKMCALPVTGCIDCRTWNMLAAAGDELMRNS